jgi:hypothetical protein
VPVTLLKGRAANDTDLPDIVDRKVKGLLNKLTMEKFDSISDQIQVIVWANKSESEKDGRTLIRLVIEKVTDEATCQWSEMYARLCRKMMEQIRSSVQDDGIRNVEGKPITGGQLIRKYLLDRCQEDFERGWTAKEVAAAAAASRPRKMKPSTINGRARMSGGVLRYPKGETARSRADQVHWRAVPAADADGVDHARVREEAAWERPDPGGD